eukprot:scaffold4033_cov57-Attheya_sp.AAC.2
MSVCECEEKAVKGCKFLHQSSAVSHIFHPVVQSRQLIWPMDRQQCPLATNPSGGNLVADGVVSLWGMVWWEAVPRM